MRPMISVVMGLALGACEPVPAKPATDDGLEPLEAFEGADELDEPLQPPDTVPDGVQIPWVGPAVPGLAGETNTVTVSQVVPGNRIFLLLAPEGGTFLTPDCGLTLDLDDPELLGIVEGDGVGVATFDFEVELADADRDLVFQAVDLESCVVSAPSRVSFKDPGPGPTTTTPGTTGSTTQPGTTTTPGTIPPAGDPVACYPGDREVYDVCVTLTPAGSQGSDYAYPSSSSSNYQAPTAYLWVDDIPGSVLVAPNFRRDELAQDWKGDWAVVQVHAVERLQDLRDDLGAITVNSGYRSPDYNASVGGATLSRHMYGDAFDMALVSGSLSSLESGCYAQGAGFVSVYVSHVHCDWRDDQQEDAFYGAGSPPPPLPTGQVVSGRVPVPSVRVEAVGRLLTAPVLEGFECGEPLREWVAYGADGQVIGEGTGATYEAPAGASEVSVTVGRVVEARLALSP